MILDERKQKILAAVIHAHVRTAGPVASEQVTSFCDLGVKSATIRNEMAEMSEMGYLRQPHTSAGRIPSDKGYRFYADRPMPGEPPPRQAERPSISAHSAVDDLMAATCRVLSAITNLVAMATVPSAETVSLQWLDVRRSRQSCCGPPGQRADSPPLLQCACGLLYREGHANDRLGYRQVSREYQRPEPGGGQLPSPDNARAPCSTC